MIPRRDRQTQRFEIVQALGVAGQLDALHLLYIKDEDAQPPAAGDPGVLLPQRAGRRVARVFEGRRPLQFLFLAQLLKDVVGHIDFAPHFQISGQVVPFEGLGDAADGADIFGHVLAHHAVSAGGGPHQLAILIFQAAGQAVDFDLHHVLRLHPGIPDTPVEVPQFLVAEGVQQALHLHGVGHFGKPPAGGAPHMLGGGIRRHQLGVGGFQFPQLPGQGVVLEVLQLGGVLVVIKTVVVFDQRAQFSGTLFGLFQFQHRLYPLCLWTRSNL